ncbi:MAG: CBU_0592 family membrane protein [Pseudomonadota bacterium]
MTASDLIGTLGVSILLIAFVLNQRRMLSEHSRTFLGMNLGGAVLCACSAWLVRFMPFVVLESVWAAVAGWGLLRWRPDAQD